MPPRLYSRYSFTAAYTDATTGKLVLADREIFPYTSLPDNRAHVVQEGDSLFSLAAFYFASLPRPAGLWWIIADFQPPAPAGTGPIFDPTLALTIGSTIVIPSIRTVTSDVFSAARQAEATL